MKSIILTLMLSGVLAGCATTNTGSKEPISVEVGGSYQIRGITHIK